MLLALNIILILGVTFVYLFYLDMKAPLLIGFIAWVILFSIVVISFAFADVKSATIVNVLALLVQVFIAIFLFIYAAETLKLRKSSEEQVKVTKEHSYNELRGYFGWEGKADVLTVDGVKILLVRYKNFGRTPVHILEFGGGRVAGGEGSSVGCIRDNEIINPNRIFTHEVPWGDEFTHLYMKIVYKTYNGMAYVYRIRLRVRGEGKIFCDSESEDVF